MAKKKETPRVQSFDIEVCRIGYAFHTITVEATSQKEAEEKALDKAGDYLYSEKTAEYVIAE